MSTELQLEALPARKATGRGPRVWAGTVLILAGLTLMGFGGCFLIGAMMLLRPDFVAPSLPATDMTGPAIWLLNTCFVVAFVCLAAGGILVFLGVRGLLRILEEKTIES